MYITPKQRRRNFWVTLILILGLPLTAFAAVMAIRYFTGASGETFPKNVVITNLTSNAVSITWTTDSPTAGSVTVNGGKGDSSPFIDIRGTDRRKTHHVDIVDLDPSKDYSFIILSNDQRYTDEKGKGFKFRTAPVTSDIPIPTPIYGEVEGRDKDDVVVFVTLDGDEKVYPASSATTATGKWIVDLSALRDPASKNLVKVDKNTNITITVKGVDTLGGMISGTFGELVDTEGQLQTVIQLNDIPTETLFAKIPSSAQISAIKQQIQTPIPTQSPDKEPETPDNNQENGGGVIAQDVKWKSLAGTTGTSAEINVPTGEDSVQITNITDTGFSVVWLSKTASQGSVKYGTTITDLSEIALDERDSTINIGKYTTHSVKLSRLQPNTQYYFEIFNDSSVIRDNGQPFSITTFPTLSTPPEFKTVTGKVSNVADPADSIVIVKISDADNEGTKGTSTLSSTLTDSSGNWVVTIGDVRKSDGSEYYSFSENDKITASVLGLTNVKPRTLTIKTSLESPIALEGEASTTRKIVKIAALANYNVYTKTVPAEVKPETGGGGDISQDLEYTPKTAVSKPLLVTLVLGVILIISGTLVYSKSNRKYKEHRIKEKMISSVI